MNTYNRRRMEMLERVAGYFVSPAAPIIVPGAAFFGAALVFFAALVLAVRWLRPGGKYA